jgi:hypothetical protein
MNGVVEIFVGLLLAVAGLALLARKLHIPYPVFFVIGGLLLGGVPVLPSVRLNPKLVLLFFLPPLLFPAALFTSWRDFRANLRPITLLVGSPLLLFSTEYERRSRAALQQERCTLLQLRNQGVINDEALRRIQLDIDLAEARLREHQ